MNGLLHSCVKYTSLLHSEGEEEGAGVGEEEMEKSASVPVNGEFLALKMLFGCFSIKSPRLRY